MPRLHVVTDDAVLAADGFEDRARAVLATGGRDLALHLRGPGTDGRGLFALADALSGEAARAGALLVVNDRVDVACAAGVDAVHLGRRSLDPDDARRVVPAVRIGMSCHDADQIAGAVSHGAAWIFLGNVFETTSHPDRPGLGLDRVQTLIGGAGAVPVIAIGGVTPALAPDVLTAGAFGIAVRSGIWDAGTPHVATSEYISVLQAHAGGF